MAVREFLQLNTDYRGFPFEPIVMTPQEVEQRLKIGDQFIAEILENGEVLYAA